MTRTLSDWSIGAGCRSMRTNRNSENSRSSDRVTQSTAPRVLRATTRTDKTEGSDGETRGSRWTNRTTTRSRSYGSRARNPTRTAQAEAVGDHGSAVEQHGPDPGVASKRWPLAKRTPYENKPLRWNRARSAVSSTTRNAAGGCAGKVVLVGPEPAATLRSSGRTGVPDLSRRRRGVGADQAWASVSVAGIARSRRARGLRAAAGRVMPRSGPCR
jgi:hypothetical protein